MIRKELAAIFALVSLAGRQRREIYGSGVEVAARWPRRGRHRGLIQPVPRRQQSKLNHHRSVWNVACGWVPLYVIGRYGTETQVSHFGLRKTSGTQDHFVVPFQLFSRVGTVSSPNADADGES